MGSYEQTSILTKGQIERWLRSRSDLEVTRRVHERLRSVLAAMERDHRRFVLGDVLADQGADFPTDTALAQDAFHDFMESLNNALAQAGIPVRIKLTLRKVSPPERQGWFEGPELVNGELIRSITGGSTSAVEDLPALYIDTQLRTWMTVHENSRFGVLVGDAGSGKSVACQQAAMQWNAGGGSCLYITADQLAREVPAQHELLDGLIVMKSPVDRSAGPADLLKELDSFPTVVIVDGWDTACSRLSTKDQAILARSLADLVGRNQRSKLLFVTRAHFFSRDGLAKSFLWSLMEGVPTHMESREPKVLRLDGLGEPSVAKLTASLGMDLQARTLFHEFVEDRELTGIITNPLMLASCAGTWLRLPTASRSQVLADVGRELARRSGTGMKIDHVVELSKRFTTFLAEGNRTSYPAERLGDWAVNTVAEEFGNWSSQYEDPETWADGLRTSPFLSRVDDQIGPIDPAVVESLGMIVAGRERASSDHESHSLR